MDNRTSLSDLKTLCLDVLTRLEADPLLVDDGNYRGLVRDFAGKLWQIEGVSPNDKHVNQWRDEIGLALGRRGEPDADTAVDLLAIFYRIMSALESNVWKLPEDETPPQKPPYEPHTIARLVRELRNQFWYATVEIDAHRQPHWSNRSDLTKLIRQIEYTGGDAPHDMRDLIVQLWPAFMKIYPDLVNGIGQLQGEGEFDGLVDRLIEATSLGG